MNTQKIEELNKKIDELQREIDSLKGTETEVYARIVGYYRSVANWNRGKREEFNIRKNFIFNGDACDCTHTRIEVTHSEPQVDISGRILCFVRKTCPNCPPMKTVLEESGLSVEYIDVDTHEGMDLAMQFSIMKAPTVLFLDADNKEQARTGNAAELKSLLTAAV